MAETKDISEMIKMRRSVRTFDKNDLKEETLRRLKSS